MRPRQPFARRVPARPILPRQRRAPLGRLGLCAAAALFLAPEAKPAPVVQTADVLIRGGTIYTGAEAPPFVGDVTILGDKILSVGPSGATPPAARRVISAQGLVVAPGFIDPHTHPETYLRSPDPVLRTNAPWLAQGVSTVFIGVDGSGSPDVRADQAQFSDQGVGVNLASYVGFGAVRERILKQANRAPSASELAAMKALVAQGMCQGAIGLSTGLFYPPQSFAATEEVVALAREAARRGGVYDTHQRDESDYGIGVLNSVREVLQIGREAGLPVHFAHLKALGVDVQGQAPAIIALIDAARAKGQVVTADQYPWLASGSSLQASLVPSWAMEGGYEALIRRLDDPLARRDLLPAMRENLRRRGGAGALLLTDPSTPWSGRTLEAVAQAEKADPVEAAIRIMRSGEGRDAVASFNMAQSDVDLIMRQPWVVTSSDGSDGHPRQYATFPEKYAIYVRKRGLITMGDFIRRSSGLTADMFNLDRRGYLRPGYFADILVLDPARYAPKADYLHPKALSEGVRVLYVNGRAALEDGRATGVLAGRPLPRVPPPGACP